MNIQRIRYQKEGCINGKHRIDMDKVEQVWDWAGVDKRNYQYKCLDCGINIFLDSVHAVKQAKRTQKKP